MGGDLRGSAPQALERLLQRDDSRRLRGERTARVRGSSIGRGQGGVRVGRHRGEGLPMDQSGNCASRRCDPRLHPLREDAVLSNQARVFLRRSGAMWIGERARVWPSTNRADDKSRAPRASPTTRFAPWLKPRRQPVDRNQGRRARPLEGRRFTSFKQADGLPNDSIQAPLHGHGRHALIATRQA